MTDSLPRLISIRFVRLFITLAWLCASVGAFAAKCEPIDLDRAPSEYDLVGSMCLLDAPADAPMSPVDAIAADEWVPVASSQERLVAPRQQSLLWLKASLSNPGGDALQRWIEFYPWRLSEVQVWLIDPQTGVVRDQILNGLDIPITERRVHSRRTLVPVILSAGESAQMLVRIRSDHRPRVMVTAWDPEAFSRKQAERMKVQSLFTAVMLTVVVVLVLQYRMGYVLLGAWALSVFVLELEKDGFLSYLLFPSMSYLSPNLIAAVSVFEKALFLAMSVHLLGLNTHRLWRWALPVGLIVAGAYSLATAVIDGGKMRTLAVVLHLGFILSWPALVPAALSRSGHWKYVNLAVLGCVWVATAAIVIGYAQGVGAVSAFNTFRVAASVLALLVLLWVFGRRIHEYERRLVQNVQRLEQADRERLERLVDVRTQELKHARQEAEKANAAKTEFLRRVTHNLKSPLTAIMGYAQLLRAEPGRVGRMSGIIHDSADHMLNLLTRLIDYARDVTVIEASPRDVYLHTFIDSIRNEAEILAGRNGNVFRLERVGTFDPVVRCDETLLREILLNLLENAAKYTREGEIVLEVSTEPASSCGGKSLVWVIRDSGSGISKADQTLLFEPFYRVASHGDGVGLGLPIVKTLVGKVGGDIRLESELGVGTCVRISMPIEQGDEALVKIAMFKLPCHMLPQFDAEGRLAWVVEDVFAIRELLDAELSEMGFLVRVFVDAESAIAALKAAEPHERPVLVLTDHRLPGENGDVVLRAIKQVDPTLPVLLLSATRDIETPPPATDWQYAARLPKPVDLVHFRSEIAKVCALEQVVAGPAGAESQPQSIAAPVAWPPDSETVTLLRHWLSLGAVTDLVEWCEAAAARYPAHAAIISDLRLLAERGQFNAFAARVLACQDAHAR